MGVALETSWSLNQRYLNWKELLEDSTQPLAQSKTNFKARGGFIRKSPLHPPPPTACGIASLFISLWIAHLQGSIIEKCLKGVISAAHTLQEATLRASSISLSVLDTSHIWPVHQAELFPVSYWNSLLPTHFAAEIFWRLQSPEDKKIQCFLTTQGCSYFSCRYTRFRGGHRYINCLASAHLQITFRENSSSSAVVIYVCHVTATETGRKSDLLRLITAFFYWRLLLLPSGGYSVI